ncbi:MAG: stage II sporulation protein M [Paracoccaceae bacterium]
MSERRQLMRSSRFRAEREADWRNLESIVGRVEKQGMRSLTFQEARNLATLYRQATTSLSLAREISLDRGLLMYLDALCARAYLAVYAPQESLHGLMKRLFVTGIPGAVRRSAGVIGLAYIALVLGGLAGYLLFQDDPSWYNTFMPEGLTGGRGLGSSRGELMSYIYNRNMSALDQLGAFASYLFSHNTQIAIFVFSLGVLVCAPSLALTFYNGLVLGAFVALHADRGLGIDIFAWLSIHGVTEISAIAIACAGGFLMGLAILFPGRLTRRDALRNAGRDATKLAILAATMLLVAALLEGFGRQLFQSVNSRIAIGWGTGALWLAYFVFTGRTKRRRQ